MDVLYFAWVRERIGLPRERVESQATTVAELIEELRGREERYALAFSDLPRCAWPWIRSSRISTRRYKAHAKWPFSHR